MPAIRLSDYLTLKDLTRITGHASRPPDTPLVAVLIAQKQGFGIFCGWDHMVRELWRDAHLGISLEKAMRMWPGGGDGQLLRAVLEGFWEHGYVVDEDTNMGFVMEVKV